MILVDTSIWIDHINKGPDEHLELLLAGESVVVHPFVFGEIAMGSVKSRLAQLTFLGDLHAIETAEEMEVRALVENQALYGTGMSYIEAHLLTAALATSDIPVRIWTRDKALLNQAVRLGVAYAP
ncbi:MAG: type II toxin-antitoxin system VapC family toxin [Sphingomicrobium sp.]